MKIFEYFLVSCTTIVVLQISEQVIPKPNSVKVNSLKSGALANIPTTCTDGDLFTAIDQEQPLLVCMNGSYHPFVSTGPSGAVAMKQGTVDILPDVVPRLAVTNQFTGLNSFKMFKLVPQTTYIDCIPENEGMFWVDKSDSKNSKVRVCLVVNGVSQWTTLFSFAATVW